MKSSVGEVVPLLQAIQITDRVEEWLLKLSNEMKHTLKELLVRCVETHDINSFPSQILCVAESIHFTQDCERYMQAKKLDTYALDLKKSLARYTSYQPDDTISRLKVKALVLDIIHNMDVVNYLIKEGATIDSWAWQKQLRFYLDEARVCKGKMSDAVFTYTYEYQGNAPKLVHTPLTDKCYLTLTQAIDNGYGGNPYGPAGTGKTESVKALGQLLGRQVLVFNCDEGIDFKSMGRIFTGIVKCGAWGCFDEFNRLDEEVLSAVSQQIQVIQSALKNKDSSLVLLNSTIDVDVNSGNSIPLTAINNIRYFCNTKSSW
jgi:dynein heavy chain 2